LIAGEVDRLSRSVSQLLSFSRPAAVSSLSASLGEIVENVILIAGSEAGENAVKIISNLQADPDFDGERVSALKEILINLTLNAAQAIKGGGVVRIESAPKPGDQLHLSVTDDGSGIPESMQEKIFEPFFTTKQRGTGLGLSIVARRVRELDGTIKVISPAVNGRGTRFDLFLPV
jgi:signal transduction histidine kinase